MEAEPENSVEFIAGDNACVTDETPSKLSLSSESEVRSDEEAEQTLSLSTSGLDESVESPSKKARSELSTPTNLTAHHGRSRPTNCTDIPEFVRSFEEASELIRKYERDTATKHTIFQTNGMADFMSNAFDLTKHRIFYEDVKTSGRAQQIKFDGVPFIVAGANTYECHQGPDRHVNVRIKRNKMYEEAAAKGDLETLKKRRGRRVIKKLNCPAKVIVRKIIRFPSYKIEKLTEYLGRKNTKALKAAWESNTLSDFELRYYIQLPDIDDHCCPPINEESSKKRRKKREFPPIPEELVHETIIEGTFNGNTFTLKGQGVGRPYDGQIHTTLESTTGPLHFPVHLLDIVASFGYPTYSFHHPGTLDLFKVSHGYEYERHIKYESGGYMDTSHKVTRYYRKGLKGHFQIREGNNVKGIGIGDYQVKPSLFTQTIWNSLWLMSSFYNQTCSTFQLYPSFILDPENSLMLAGLEVKWALMKCRSAVTGECNDIPELESIEPIYETFIPAGPGKIKSKCVVAWRKKEGGLFTATCDSEYRLRHEDFVDGLQCRIANFVAHHTQETMDQTEGVDVIRAVLRPSNDVASEAQEVSEQSEDMDVIHPLSRPSIEEDGQTQEIMEQTKAVDVIRAIWDQVLT